MKKAHEHKYAQHPNPRWATHVCCTICGFAVAKSVLRPLVLDPCSGALTVSQREQLRSLVEAQ